MAPRYDFNNLPPDWFPVIILGTNYIDVNTLLTFKATATRF